MSAKDKAENLVNEYRVMLMQTDTDAGEEILCTSIAKECAMIAVDEILEALNSVRLFRTELSEVEFFYEDVIIEIISL
jgi:hypothetical protein